MLLWRWLIVLSGMSADIERWIEEFPRAVGFVEGLYKDER